MMLCPAFSAASAARITSMTMKLGMPLRTEAAIGVPSPIIAAAAANRPLSRSFMPLHYADVTYTRPMRPIAAAAGAIIADAW